MRLLVGYQVGFTSDYADMSTEIMNLSGDLADL